MFEVFAGMCFYAAAALRQCDDFVVDSYDDQLTCEIVANDYATDRRWINPGCVPSPEVEPMPEGEPLEGEEIRAVTSYMIDNLDAGQLSRMYAEQSKK